MPRRLLPLSFLLAFLFSLVSAQIPESSIGFTYLGMRFMNRTSVSSLGTIDQQLLESRLKTDLLEIARQEKYTLAIPEPNDQLLQSLSGGNKDQIRSVLSSQKINLSTNGFIYADLIQLPDGITLNIKLMENPGLEVVMERSLSFTDAGQVMPQLTAAVYDIFGLAVPDKRQPGLAANSGPVNNVGAYLKDKELHLSDLAGEWQGDYLLSRVLIKADGTALAYFNDQDFVRLKVNIQNQYVVLLQDEPNSPKLYLNAFPFSIASQVVRLARPWSWEFMLSVEKDRLVGRKNTSYFYIEQGSVIQVDNNYSREAVWVRM